LRWLARIYAGGTPDKDRIDFWVDGTVPWLNSGAVNDWAITRPSALITEAGLSGSSAKWIPPGSVLVALAGQGKTKGTAARLEFSATCNQSMAAIVPGEHLDYRYLHHWLSANYLSLRNLAGGDQRDGLNLQHVGNVGVPVPPLEEQHRIADFLDDQVRRIGELIRLREAQIAGLAEHLASRAHEAVTGESHAHRSESPLPWSPSLPSHWDVVRLATIAELGTGHTPSKSVDEYWRDCTIPWLTTTDVKFLRSDDVETLMDTQVHISELGLANSAAVMHPAGTVGLCRTSASAGYSAIMGVPMATSQDFAVWRPTPLLVPEYLLWCMRAMRADLLDRLAMGSTHKTIYFPDLEGIRIPLPPLDEQRAIAKIMTSEMTHVSECRRQMRAQVQLLQERKRSLITAAVTGELDVTTARGVA
jgi:type I restriction enzyme S subunit